MRCKGILDKIDVKNLRDIGVSRPIEKIITEMTDINKISFGNNHDYWDDEPRHDHYRDDPSG